MGKIQKYFPRMISYRRRYLNTSLVLFLLVVFAVTGCDGLARTQEVKAKAFPSGQVLTLPIKAKWFPGDYINSGVANFESSDSFQELRQKIAELPGVEIERTDLTLSNTALIINNETGKNPDFFNFSAKTPHKFMITATSATFSDNQGGKFTLLFPTHLFSDPRILGISEANLFFDKEYEIALAEDKYSLADVKNQFQAFYDRSQIYQTASNQNSLTVTPISKADKEAMIFSFSQVLETVFVKTTLID